MTVQFTTPTIPRIDYTSKDFESIINDLVNRIQDFNPEWTDFNPSDPGITLLELYSIIADNLHFQLDRQANESFLETAAKRESVIKLLRLINFELKSAVPSTVTLDFTLDTSLGGDLTIPAGTELQTIGETDPIFFETDVDLIISSPGLTGSIAATEGQTGTENLAVSTGATFQRRTLLAIPVIDGSLRMFIDEGSGEQEWDEVDSFINSGASDLEYTVERDADDKITIIFGDGANGKVPLTGATMRTTFRTGGGARGNIGANVITVINSQILFAGSPVSLSVDNALASTGGADKQSIEDAKVLGPRSLRSLNRAVTIEDYTTLSLTFAGVGKAKAIGKGFVDLDIVVAPSGGGIPSTGLKDNLKTFLDTRKCAGTILTMVNPVFVNIDITGTVFVLGNFVQDDVRTAVLDAIDAEFIFTNPNRNFGVDVFNSDIVALIDNIEGVDHVDLTKLTKQIVIDLSLWTGGGTFSTIVLGGAAVDETWTITATGPTTFTATGSVSGLQTATGTFGVAYSSDNTEITFTITVGSPANQAGDIATFLVSELVGNVEVGDLEISQKGVIALTFSGGA